MLVHHPDSQLVGVIGAVNLLDASADDDFTCVRQVISHDAFYERTFSGSVLAEQRVKGAGFEFQGDLFVRDKRAEPLRDPNQLKAGRQKIGETGAHELAAMNDWEFETAPKTPPCILIICRADR